MLSLPFRLVNALGRAAGQITDPAILRILGKSMLITVFLLIVFGWSGALLIEAGLARYDTVFSDGLGALIGFLLAGIGAWLLFRIVALMVLQFFADDIVHAVEKRHYPGSLLFLKKRTFREELHTSIRAIIRTLGANGLALMAAIPLAFTAIGPALVFFVVNAWLIGRELRDLVWFRYGGIAETSPPLGPITRLALGSSIAGLMAVPVANLFAPFLGAAAATHLIHRELGFRQNGNPHAR